EAHIKRLPYDGESYREDRRATIKALHAQNNRPRPYDGESSLEERRATIKALPAQHNRPRPYDGESSLGEERATIKALPAQHNHPRPYGDGGETHERGGRGGEASASRDGTGARYRTACAACGQTTAF